MSRLTIKRPMKANLMGKWTRDIPSNNQSHEMQDKINYLLVSAVSCSHITHSSPTYPVSIWHKSFSALFAVNRIFILRIANSNKSFHPQPTRESCP
jgi:hypothetical protein